MDFSDMSLAELFAAADAIADHREPEEVAAVKAEIAEAQAELAEAIGYDCESDQ